MVDRKIAQCFGTKVRPRKPAKPCRKKYLSPIPSTAEVFLGTSLYSVGAQITLVGGGGFVPEPSTGLLLGIGLVGMTMRHRSLARVA